RSEIAGFSTEPYETLQFKATKTDPLSQKISMLSVVQSQLMNNKSQDFLEGYHAAVVEITRAATAEWNVAADAHKAARDGLFGRATKFHYEQMGKCAAYFKIGQIAAAKATRAFELRMKGSPHNHHRPLI
ncbi:MAG: hypothetical protein ACK5LJ_07050, partial [Paracoccus sp. (in: a-proteobacteria)]